MKAQGKITYDKDGRPVIEDNTGFKTNLMLDKLLEDEDDSDSDDEQIVWDGTQSMDEIMAILERKGVI